MELRRNSSSEDRPLCDDGKIIGMIVVARDITEQKRAEQALQDQVDQYLAILGTTPDGFYIIDDKGKLLDVNDNYCRMSGYSREELLQTYASDLEAAETVEDTDSHILNIIQKGADRFETRHRTKEGWYI